MSEIELLRGFIHLNSQWSILSFLSLSVLCCHIIKSLHVVISFGLIGLLKLGEACTLSVNRLKVILEFRCNFILAWDDEHATDWSENLLLTLRRLEFLNSLECQLGLNLLALGNLEWTISNTQLLDCRQKLTLVLSQLNNNHR